MFLTVLLKVHCDFGELDHKMTENRYHILSASDINTEPYLCKECCQESVIKINYCLGILPSGGGKAFHSPNLCISFLSCEKLRQSTVFGNSVLSCFRPALYSKLFQSYCIVKALFPYFSEVSLNCLYFGSQFLLHFKKKNWWRTNRFALIILQNLWLKMPARLYFL